MSGAFSIRLSTDLATRAALLSLVSNLFLMVLKISAGIASGSIAVLSDGIDSAQDVVASGIVFASVRIGRRPPDLHHPYGHGRAETIAAMLQATLITLGGGYITFRGVERLISPVEQIDSTLALIAIGITAIVNFIVVLYVGHVAKVTNSPAIASDARHLWTNIVQALAIFAALVLVAVTGLIVFDAVVALLLGAYLLYVAGLIFWTSIGDILDVSLKRDEIDFVDRAITSQQGHIGYHDLRTRRTGQIRYIDFHLMVPGDMTVAQSHDITEAIEATIKRRWPGALVMIHVDPAHDEPVIRVPIEEAEGTSERS